MKLTYPDIYAMQIILDSFSKKYATNFSAILAGLKNASIHVNNH